MSNVKYLIVTYVMTTGLHDEDLGSDEEEIVLFAWLVIDTTTSKIIERICHYVKPKNKDINDNILAEMSSKDNVTGITEDKMKHATSLDNVLLQMDHYINTHLNDESFCLITDGQLHLRQVLHPEAIKKAIVLPPYYHRFYDLRKEFRKCYRNNDMRTVEDMLECHIFDEHEIINDKLEPGICTKNEFVDGNTVVRARGLPWQSTDQDIANFFIGLNIVKGGVALCLSVQGRRNGEALVRFVNQEHRDMALRRHKHHIGQRYIEVYRATGDDFLNVAGGGNNEAHTFLSRGGQAIVRMRGLPYDCTALQVIDFFSSNEPVEVLHGEDGVLFVRKPDGRPTGDAFVLFECEDVAAKALLKHRESIGTRYIELFRSTTAEVQQVFNRNMDPRVYDNSMQQPLLSSLVNQQLIHTNSRKDCIRLRGLPYEAQVEQILAFLGDHSKKIIFQGVHMVYNAQGQPSGEAFIQMDSEQSAALASQQRHHRYMIFGKKQRYIEVFQCSVDDMNLTGGIQSQRPLLSSAGTLLTSPFPPFPYGHVAHTGAPNAVPPPAPHSVLPINGTNPAVTLAVTHHHQQAVHSGSGRMQPPASYAPYNPNPFNLIYWHYPSPPVSPTAYFAAHHSPSPAMVNMRGLR
ncbi:hypothetical protein RDWZM_006846 [Blomia tropicalis]|uniref:RRM domain-containing protein n=1 Tax=Blomia tropicalis TaxID=40697 RepID=A0A9Q0RNR2_BLOTA|nr:hypothetical protein RDWZM_006846 [Blomia tropicalis]